MGGKCQYTVEQQLNWLKHTNAAAAPTTGYLALFTTLSTLLTQGTEVSGGSYARKSITMGTGFSAIAATADSLAEYIANAADLTFATPTADWGLVVGWELLDASSGGNRLYWGELNPNQFVANGFPLTILAGSLVIQES